jgi:hypothetical protein
MVNNFTAEISGNVQLNHPYEELKIGDSNPILVEINQISSESHSSSEKVQQQRS